jgi:hypothetical protein
VRRAFAWLAGLAGVAALGRAAARRRHRSSTATVPSPAPAEPAGDPADALRARLDEQRQRQTETPDTAAPETLEERRARIHEKAQQAIDAMREPTA